MLLVGLAAGLVYGIYVGRLLTTPASAKSDVVTFTVTSGEPLKDVSARLAQQGLIKNDYWFRTYISFRGWDTKFLAGQHQLKKDMSILDVARNLTSSTNVSLEKTITIIEGWNDREIGQYLQDHGVGTKKDFLREVAKTGWQTKYVFLDDKPLGVDLEGYLFPDTYRIYGDASVDDVIKKMLDNFDSKLTPQMRTDIKKRGLTVHDVLTVASIVEEEVRGDGDRKKVADIFYKRLKAGIPLQADSTVNYVTGKSAASVSAKDLQVKSLYNTYQNRGLPPGPISNPGLSSIMAAIYPESNPYYYFLTTPDGRVLYAKTLEEHNKNKQQL